MNDNYRPVKGGTINGPGNYPGDRLEVDEEGGGCVSLIVWDGSMGANVEDPSSKPMITIILTDSERKALRGMLKRTKKEKR